MEERVTLKVKPETRRELKVYCAENGVTYDEGIMQLLGKSDES